MESAWQLSLLVYQSWTFFDVTLRRRHEICFCDFSGWTWTSNLSPLKNRKKKKERYFTFWWGFRWCRRRCCWSFLLFSTRSSCFNSNDVAFANYSRVMILTFRQFFFIFYHNEMATGLTVIFWRYCFTRSLYLFASCFIFFTPNNIWFLNKCLILNLSPFISNPIHYMDRQLVD